jgi:hypothetical protein
MLLGQAGEMFLRQDKQYLRQLFAVAEGNHNERTQRVGQSAYLCAGSSPSQAPTGVAHLHSTAQHSTAH